MQSNKLSFLFIERVPVVEGRHPVRMRMLHGGNPVFKGTHRRGAVPVICGAPGEPGVQMLSSWFNLSIAFLNTISKHFGNKNVHNGLAWSSYFLSQHSSCASPSGLAQFQKQILHSSIPVALLTLATVPSGSPSCLCFLKNLCSHRRSGQITFAPCPS